MLLRINKKKERKECIRKLSGKKKRKKDNNRKTLKEGERKRIYV